MLMTLAVKNKFHVARLNLRPSMVMVISSMVSPLALTYDTFFPGRRLFIAGQGWNYNSRNG